MTDQEINDRLRVRGVAAHLQGSGRSGLVNRWRAFIEEVEKGYKLGLDDYRNDLDLREIIQAVGLGDDPEIRSLDARLRAQLQDTDRRVWVSDYPDAFWVRGYPRHVPEDFLATEREEEE